jgi:phosphatidylglycerophosphate synthase
MTSPEFFLDPEDVAENSYAKNEEEASEIVVNQDTQEETSDEDLRTLKDKLLTVPNAITTAGLGLTLDGAKHSEEWRGFFEGLSGRLLDLVDGKAARWLEDHKPAGWPSQKSEVGALYDAGADKIGVAATLAAQWRSGAAPKVVLGGIVAENLFNTGATAYASRYMDKEDIERSTAGGWSMLAANIALGAYEAGNIFEKGHYESAARTSKNIGHIAAVTGLVVLGIPAMAGYGKRALQARQNGKAQ